jgi:cell division protease FtsH
VLGPLRYSENQEEVFLGHSVTQTKNVSESTQKVIDEETRRLVEIGGTTARSIIEGHLGDLHVIANALLEYETLSREEIDALLRGEDISRDEDSEDQTPPTGSRSSVPTSGPVNLGPEPQPGG